MPDVTAVTAILIRPETAVETTDIGRSVGRSDFGLRLLAAMVILGAGQAAGQPDPDASLSGCSRSEYSIARVRDETLKRHSQSDITKRGWFTDLCDRGS